MNSQTDEYQIIINTDNIPLLQENITQRETLWYYTLTVAEMGSLLPGIKKCKLTVPVWLTFSLVPVSVSINITIKSEHWWTLKEGISL